MIQFYGYKKCGTCAKALKLLAGNGRLIKRPLVTDGLKTTVGYQAELFQKAWR